MLCHSESNGNFANKAWWRFRPHPGQQVRKPWKTAGFQAPRLPGSPFDSSQQRTLCGLSAKQGSGTDPCENGLRRLPKVSRKIVTYPTHTAAQRGVGTCAKPELVPARPMLTEANATPSCQDLAERTAQCQGRHTRLLGMGPCVQPSTLPRWCPESRAVCSSSELLQATSAPHPNVSNSMQVIPSRAPKESINACPARRSSFCLRGSGSLGSHFVSMWRLLERRPVCADKEHAPARDPQLVLNARLANMAYHMHGLLSDSPSRSLQPPSSVLACPPTDQASRGRVVAPHCRASVNAL